MNDNTRNIIVADNDYFLAKVLEKKLADAGFSVALAHDTKELSEVVNGKLPDVVLLEVASLGLRPTDVVSKIIVDARYGATCVCVLTRMDDEDIKKEFVDIGVDLYLKKTEVSFDDIVSRLGECVQKKRDNQEKK